MLEIHRDQMFDMPEGIYLNTAAEGLLPRKHFDSMREYAVAKSHGSAGRGTFADVESRVRELVGAMLSVDAATIAFVASTSRGLDAAIKSIAWKPGDNIVFTDAEFPSANFAAALLSQSGVTARRVASREGLVDETDIRSAIDARTRLVVASLVSFKTGQRLDLESLIPWAKRVGALVFVDAVQAVGSIRVEAGGADFLCAGTFKWLLGAHGLAMLYVSPNSSSGAIQPYVSYRSVTELFPESPDTYQLFDDARRYEEGMPNYLGLFMLESSLQLFGTLGIERVEQHNIALAQQLRSGLVAQGFSVSGPAERTRRGSIVSFESPHYAAIRDKLERFGTTVWARDGRVRLSPHLYNTEGDIEAVLKQFSTMRAAAL